MELTEKQVKQFREDGYTTVENFFAPNEIDSIRREVERLQVEGHLRNVLTTGDGKTESTTQQNLQLCPASLVSPLIKALPFAPQVRPALEAILGPEAIALHLDQIFIKPGRTGRGTNWHQDNDYFKIPKPIRGTAMWIAVHDATKTNGTIRVIPKAFHEPLAHVRDLNSNHHVYCKVDESKAIDLELPAGGVAFFHYQTPHATGDNNTDSMRAGLAYHFVNLHDQGEETTKRVLNFGSQHQRPYITGPDADNGNTLYGSNMVDSWTELVNGPVMV